MEPINFQKGDRVICNCRLKKKIDGKWVIRNDCQLRIIDVESYITPNYRTYNITFDRYSVIGQCYLKRDLEYEREVKLSTILEEK